MEQTPVKLLLTLALLTLPIGAGAQRGTLSPLPEEETTSVVAAVRSAAKDGRLGSNQAQLASLASKRPAAYRLGKGAFWLFSDAASSPDAIAADVQLTTAILVTRGITVGDFRRMLTASTGIPLVGQDLPPGLRVFTLNLAAGAREKRLEVRGEAPEPVLSVPTWSAPRTRRPDPSTTGPLILRPTGEEYLQITFTVGTASATIRLGPPSTLIQ